MSDEFILTPFYYIYLREDRERIPTFLSFPLFSLFWVTFESDTLTDTITASVRMQKYATVITEILIQWRLDTWSASLPVAPFVYYANFKRVEYQNKWPERRYVNAVAILFLSVVLFLSWRTFYVEMNIA